MRIRLEIVLCVAFVLVGCSDGQVAGSARPAAVPSISELKNQVTGFDYLGVLWEPTNEGRLTLPNLAVCSEGDSEYPFASCIETVTLDGSPADPMDLKAGQVVEIHGARFSWNGFANAAPPTRDSPTVTIDIQRAIVGPVEAIDVDHAWLTVLGQRVYAYDAAVAGAAIGDIVTVYGHFTAEGQTVAEFVEPYEGDPLFLLRGVLTELTPGTLAIGALEVDIVDAAREGFPGGAPLPGDTVLLLGDQPPAAGVLSATNLRCVGACTPPRWWGGPAFGFLTGWRSPTDFDVDGIAIRAEESCDCGLWPPLALGSFMDVNVAYGNAYITRAASTSRTIGLAGRITAKDPVLREIVVLGFRVHMSPATHVTADPDVPFDVLPFDGLDIGDFVEISGQALGTGIRADTVVRRGNANIVKALDYTLEEPAVEVAGRTIVTDSATQVALCQGDGIMSVGELFATPWSDLQAWLSIVVDPSSEPLVAREVVVCPPNYVEPEFNL